MAQPLTPQLQGIGSQRDRAALYPVLAAGYNAISSKSLNSAGLAIKTGGSAIVKTGAAAYFAFANGVPITKAAATDMPALVGTVVNATWNVFVFMVDQFGTVTVTMGTAGATWGAVKFPRVVPKAAVLGFIIVNPTGTGNFVGGTTALDDATVVPGVQYINSLGAFDQTATI